MVSEMKRVLIVGADFAPSSLPPATRIRFFASHLAEFGWEPIVLSTKPEYYDWPTDAENENLLPESLKVVRTKAWSPGWTRKIGFGDVGMRSLWSHWQAIKKLCRTEQIDLIFIPVPPYVPMLLGRMAHKKFGIPYVVDYIDPWVTEYYWQVPRDQRPPKWPMAYALSRLIEPYALKKVSHITGVSKGTTDSVVARYDWLSEANASDIPYGAEPDDFEYLRKHPRQNSIFTPRDGLVHLSYVGACIPGMYPAVRALFEAVKLGLVKSPQDFSRIRLHFVGTSYAPNGQRSKSIEDIARSIGIEDQVDEHPERIGYLDSLQVMLDSQALVLVGSNEPHYTASKVFPYLLSQRPVLAIFHEESSVTQILSRHDNAELMTFNAKESVESKIADIFGKLRLTIARCKQERPDKTPELLEPYTTNAMTARLANAFERALVIDSTEVAQTWAVNANGVPPNPR